MSTLQRYNKSLVLLLLIVLAFVAQTLGMDLGLDTEHYIGLIVADLLVFLVPNKDMEN